MNEEVKKSIKKNALAATDIELLKMIDSLEFVIEIGEINELEDKELKSIQDKMYALEYTSIITKAKDSKYRLNDALRFVMNARKFSQLYKESNDLNYKTIVINELLSAIEMLQKCLEILKSFYNWGAYFDNVA